MMTTLTTAFTLSTRLTPHVTLEELTRSATAQRLRINNTPPDSLLASLHRLAEVVELVRVELHDAPILISSGYRCPALNQAVGGSPHSAHQAGCAVDFTAPEFGTTEQIWQRLKASAIPFDQLILETSHGTTWVHLGIAPEHKQPRRQVLTIQRRKSD